jgi:soluble lytic murein transglycosylase-like protein
MMKQLLNEWKKFIKEETLPITNSDTVLVPSKEEAQNQIQKQAQPKTVDEIKQYIIKSIKSTGVQNILPEFAFAVANRESRFNPKAKNGSHVGLFGVGPEAAQQLGYSEEFKKDPYNLSTNTTIGLKYLQYQIDLLGKGSFEAKYSKLNLESYTLAYIAYNLGRQNMLRMVEHFRTKKEPNPGLVKAITNQSPRFKGNTDAETVLNYYNEVNSVFGKI